MFSLRLIKIFATVCIAILAIQSCSTRWTEKQKQEFALKCSQTDTAKYLFFSVTGFKYSEVENIRINRVHDGHIIDSFDVQADKSTFDSLRTRYTAKIDKTIFIKDTYEFIISGQKPFILSDMKMIMWAQFTMFSEGYGCVMGDYKIDSARFQHNANPDFVKQ